MTRISKEIKEALSSNLDNDLTEKGYKTGDTSTVDFIKLDGTRQMFAYGQLITAWTQIQDDKNIIKLFFSTHLVTIIGYNLSSIYEHIRRQDLELLMARDERYLNTAKEKQPYVTGIEIEWKSEKKP